MISEECPGDRRVRTGDQHVNADMIEQGEGLELTLRGPHAVKERAARRAEDQGKTIDHEADLLGEVPASSAPEEPNARDGKRKPESMAPRVYGFARGQEVHAMPDPRRLEITEGKIRTVLVLWSSWSLSLE